MKTSPFSKLLLAGMLAGGVLGAPGHASAENLPGGIFGATAVSPETLADQRGGAEVHILNDSTTNGAVHDSLASNVNTGSNWITDGSLAGAAGIPVVVQNSGNNVLIQNSTIVNMQVR